MDILLDELTHDAVFTNGATPVTSSISGGLKQRLKIKLLTFTGEWFLDVNYGTPYFQEIVGKNRSKATIDIILRDVISADKDVIDITRFESTLSTDRVYSLNFSVKSRDGTTIEITELEVGI
jgi:hypothetical protein